MADLWLQGLSEIKWRPKHNPGGKGINEWYYFFWSRCLSFREKHSFYSITFLFRQESVPVKCSGRRGRWTVLLRFLSSGHTFTWQMCVRILLFLSHNSHFEVWLSWEFQLLGLFNDQVYCAAQAPKDFKQFELKQQKKNKKKQPGGNLVPCRPANMS